MARKRKTRENADILEVHDFCSVILGRAYDLHCIIKYGPDLYCGGMDLDLEDFIQQYRTDFITRPEPPDALSSCKLELDAASGGIVRVTQSHVYSNWHEATLRFYILSVNDLWKELVQSDIFDLILLRRSQLEDPKKTIFPPITIAGIKAGLEAIRKLFAEEFVFDRVIARASMERELALVIQQRSLMGVGDRDAGPLRRASTLIRDKDTELRDKWIYAECCKGTAYDAIIFQLTKKPENWSRIDSRTGIRGAAQRYARRHNLPPIPRRQDS